MDMVCAILGKGHLGSVLLLHLAHYSPTSPLWLPYDLCHSLLKRQNVGMSQSHDSNVYNNAAACFVLGHRQCWEITSKLYFVHTETLMFQSETVQINQTLNILTSVSIA